MLNYIGLPTTLNIPAQGWTISIVGWLIVFTALVALVILFTQLPKLVYYKTRKKLRQEKKAKMATRKAAAGEKGDDHLQISGDESAAIAMALQLFFGELHDEESNIIQIKRINKRYSPWSSKIYGLREWPRNN